MVKWHPDWPEWDAQIDNTWSQDQPVTDVLYALAEYASEIPFRAIDIENIERYFVSYHGETWTPTGDAGGSELEMFLFGKLRDGRWFVLEAGNDYTGWGCQDWVTATVHETAGDAIFDGCTADMRSALNLTIDQCSGGIGSMSGPERCVKHEGHSGECSL